LELPELEVEAGTAGSVEQVSGNTCLAANVAPPLDVSEHSNDVNNDRSSELRDGERDAIA
jgi:hypothetical protein